MNTHKYNINQAVSKRGSSLLEFILYFAVISLVLTAVVGFAANFMSIHARSALQRDVSRDGRYAVSRITAEIRSADGVNIGDSVFDANPGRLSLSMADSAIDPTVFAVNDNLLTVSRGGGDFEPVITSASEVSEFTVRNVSVSGRSKVFSVLLKLISTDTSQLEVESLFETTAQIRKGQGFPN